MNMSTAKSIKELTSYGIMKYCIFVEN